ncbi:MAG: TetR family transcriptional regulator [Acidipropionibacterium sp.]|jgi:DNA-binding transcriptional regulator YbjK|nr:TetR family transcriptional regulator [Acidipropionibacterium sp.]
MTTDHVAGDSRSDRERRSGTRQGRRNDPDRRDRIIDACLDVIAEYGVAGASHRKIADAASVPLGSMTYHFSGMDELLYEAFTRFATTVSERFDRRMAAATDPASAQAAVVAIILDDVFGDLRDLVLTHELYTLAAREPAYRDITAAWMARSRAALERHFDPETARLLDALIEGLTIHRSLDVETHDPGEVVRAVQRVCLPDRAVMFTDFTLEPEEPSVPSWRRTALAEEWEKLLAATATAPRPGVPVIVAIDGRCAAGKTTLAAELAALTPGTAIVSSDDLAWHEPLFGWAELLRENVLEPASQGRPVSFTPPAWVKHDRTGTIEVPAGTQVLIVEGAGAADAVGADLIDAVIWVQADRTEATRRGIERDLASGVNGNREQTQAFWSTWYGAERAHLAADRPWERAKLIVAGTPPAGLQPGLALVADGPLSASPGLAGHAS